MALGLAEGALQQGFWAYSDCFSTGLVSEIDLPHLCGYQNRAGFPGSGSQIGAKERNPVPAAFVEGWQRQVQVLPWAGDSPCRYASYNCGRNKWIWASSDPLSVTISREEAMIQSRPAALVNTRSLARTAGGLWDAFGSV